MGIQVSPSTGQVGINQQTILFATGGTPPYKWSLPTYASPYACPVNLVGAGVNTVQYIGQCFGMVTVTVTDSSTPAQTGTAVISVGSVTIAGPDGNYYHCFPSGASQTVDASALFSSNALGSDVFGDATNGILADASPLKKSTKQFQTTAVTCYLLNLSSFTPSKK